MTRQWRLWLAAAAFPPALLLADALLWRIAAGQLQSGLDRWMQTARARGWTVSAGPREVGGWPFAVTLAVSDLHAAGGAQLMPGGLAWSAGRVVLKVSLAHPTTLVLGAAGMQTLRLSHAPNLVFHSARFTIKLPLAAHPEAADLEAADIAAGLRGSGHPGDVQLANLHLHLVQQPTLPFWLSARLDVAARGIGLPDIGRWPLGGVVSDLAGTLLLTSPRLVSPEHHDGEPAANPEDQARQWRDGGGKLAARGLRIHWGPLRMAAQADLALDERLQPAGTGSADIVGSSQALNALAEGGVISPGLATTGQAVLAVMAPAPDAADAIRLPFLLRDNTLSAGGIPVVRLHDIAWRRSKPSDD